MNFENLLKIMHWSIKQRYLDKIWNFLLYVLLKIEDHAGYFKFSFVHFLDRNTRIAMSLTYLPLSTDDSDKLSVGVTHIKTYQESILSWTYKRKSVLFWKTLRKK